MLAAPNASNYWARGIEFADGVTRRLPLDSNSDFGSHSNWSTASTSATRLLTTLNASGGKMIQCGGDASLRGPKETRNRTFLTLAWYAPH